VDSEIKRILDEAYQGAEKALVDNRVLLDSIAEALLDRETLDADEIKLLDAGKQLPPMPKPVVEEATPAPVVQPKAKTGESPLEGTGGEPSPALA
jgi:cell division protease FtsH